LVALAQSNGMPHFFLAAHSMGGSIVCAPFTTGCRRAATFRHRCGAYASIRPWQWPGHCQPQPPLKRGHHYAPGTSAIPMWPSALCRQR
jgi:hypothetical protein